MTDFEKARPILEPFDGQQLDAGDISQDSPWNVLLEEIADELARAEKVIEAATAVLRWWDDPAPRQPKPNVPTGRVPMEALRLALAEYDRPTAPRDGEDVVT